MIKTFFLSLLFLLSGTQLFAQKADDQQIRNILNEQVAEWNNGSIERYMQGYWESDSLIFIGKNGPTYGYSTTLAHYQKSYPDRATMGKLTFEIISLQKIAVDHYFAIGKWALKRDAGDVAGSWTLLFRKINGKWKIVVDHSS